MLQRGLCDRETRMSEFVTITRKEAFECAIAFSASIAVVLNNSKTILYDFALYLMEKSLSPIQCLQPCEKFKWNDDGKYGEKSYAFIPVGYPYSDLLLGNIGKYMGEDAIYTRFQAKKHPAKWIGEVLSDYHIQCGYSMGMLSSITLNYSNPISKKNHKEWINIKCDGHSIYFPYYTELERNAILSKFPMLNIDELYDEYWIE